MDSLPTPSPPPALPQQRFDVTPFRSDGATPPAGVGLTLLYTVGAALAVGMIVSYLHQWIYLVLIFPLLMGGLVGAATAGGIRMGKVRSALLAGFIGLAGGALVMLVSYYADYRLALQQLARLFPGAQFDDVTFLKFMDVRATEGVAIGKVGGGDKGMNLGYVGSYIYWLVEIGCAAAIAFSIARLPASLPFCTGCQGWKESHELGAALLPPTAAVDLMNQGEIHRFLDPSLATGTPVAFKAHTCQNCGEESTVEINLRELTVNAKGEQKERDLGTWTYPGHSLPVWHQLFDTFRVTAPPPDNAQHGGTSS
jgi:hypothetical protein